ncbi:MAG: DUF1697 domain-containing protein [Thermoplasmatota archaeon]
MTTFVALLRAVNVGGRKVEMAELRKVAEKAGLENVRTYIASGNLVFEGKGNPADLEAQLEAAIAKKFGIDVPVLVRTPDQWTTYLQGNPFPGAEPNRLYLLLSKAPPSKDAAKTVLLRAVGGEEARLVGDALWIHYPAGMGPSKVTPAHIDKATGSPTTARNLNTVRKLAEMAGAESEAS